MRPNVLATGPNNNNSKCKAREFQRAGKPAFVAHAMTLVRGDQTFPASRRASTLSSLNKLPEWANACSSSVSALTAQTMPFNERKITELFENIVPAVVRISKKRLQNAHGDCKYVLDRYGLSRKRLRVTLNPMFAAPARKLDRFQRMAIGKWLAFLSVREIDPASVDDGVAEQFRSWLQDQGLKNVDALWRRNIVAWNKATRVDGWPDRPLTLPRRRVPSCLPWSAFPRTLEAEVVAFLTRGKGVTRLFSEEGAAPPLANNTVINQKECLRWVASALVRSGLKPEELRALRDLCRPDRFKRALDQMAVDKGFVDGLANGSIGLVADVLAKIAKYGKVLSPEEINEVLEDRRKVRTAVKLYMRDRPDPDQQLLNELDDPKIVDALLTLARRTVDHVLKSQTTSYRDAIRIQLALMVEIWLCAPIRLSNMRHLRLDRHFFMVTFGGNTYVVVRVPAAEVKNRKDIEHILNGSAVELLHLYIEKFLPILTRNNPSPWLFPGRHGSPKAPQVVRAQTSRFVRDGTGLRFHPHAIRKITPKLYLDQDPGGIEVVRRNLGNSLETTRRVYTQRVHRESQRTYHDALEKRRLAAFASMVRPRRRRKE